MVVECSVVGLMLLNEICESLYSSSSFRVSEASLITSEVLLDEVVSNPPKIPITLVSATLSSASTSMLLSSQLHDPA